MDGRRQRARAQGDDRIEGRATKQGDELASSSFGSACFRNYMRRTLARDREIARAGWSSRFRDSGCEALHDRCVLSCCQAAIASKRFMRYRV
jgi:hypothetical protein